MHLVKKLFILCTVFIMNSAMAGAGAPPGSPGPVGEMSFSHPKWWFRDLGSLQLRCVFEGKLAEADIKPLCAELAKQASQILGGRIPVRVTPELNAGFQDKGRGSLFYNATATERGDMLILGASLVIYRYDLADQITTGLHRPPVIRILVKPYGKVSIRKEVMEAFGVLFASL